MINHIKGFISRLMTQTWHTSVRGHSQLRELKVAMDGLDPRDFDPEAQVEFMLLRADLNVLAEHGATDKDKDQMLQALHHILDKYRGEGSHRVTRSFAFISDPGLRNIIERDYSELSRILFPAGAWKSTVVMAGSILEAVLLDLLTADPVIQERAEAGSRAPKVKGNIKDLAAGEWKLQDLINVAAELGVLPDERAKTFDQVLRDYRNFVHPKKEIRAGYPCADGEAMMAMGALDAICDHLTRTSGTATVPPGAGSTLAGGT